jgi:hypothetical protein
MVRPAFLANENVPSPLVRLLRDQSLVVHAPGEFMARASDRRVLQHAYKPTAVNMKFAVRGGTVSPRTHL